MMIEWESSVHKQSYSNKDKEANLISYTAQKYFDAHPAVAKKRWMLNLQNPCRDIEAWAFQSSSESAEEEVTRFQSTRQKNTWSKPPFPLLYRCTPYALCPFSPWIQINRMRCTVRSLLRWSLTRGHLDTYMAGGELFPDTASLMKQSLNSQPIINKPRRVK